MKRVYRCFAKRWRSCYWTKIFCYCIKQTDFILPCVCSVIDHKRRQNVVRTSVTHEPLLFCSFHILTSSVILNWTDARQNGIYLLNRNDPKKEKHYAKFTLGFPRIHRDSLDFFINKVLKISSGFSFVFFFLLSISVIILLTSSINQSINQSKQSKSFFLSFTCQDLSAGEKPY